MKKSVNYLLFLTVLSLWGIVGYKTYKNYFQQSNQTSSNFEEVQISNPLKLTEKDTFALLPLERNPFTANEHLKLSNSNAPKKTIIKVSTRKSADNPFPIIQYFGYIKSTASKEEIVLIKIDGALVRIRKGESHRGIKITKIYQDSVLISYGNFKKSYPRYN